jgi:hypothetical protein
VGAAGSGVATEAAEDAGVAGAGAASAAGAGAADTGAASAADPAAAGEAASGIVAAAGGVLDVSWDWVRPAPVLFDGSAFCAIAPPVAAESVSKTAVEARNPARIPDMQYLL